MPHWILWPVDLFTASGDLTVSNYDDVSRLQWCFEWELEVDLSFGDEEQRCRDAIHEDLDASYQRIRALNYVTSEIESGEIHSSFTVTAPSGHTIKFNSNHVSDQPV